MRGCVREGLGGGCVGGRIDCFHCDIIAIKGCKQPSGSVSLLSPGRTHDSFDASLHTSSDSREEC